MIAYQMAVFYGDGDTPCVLIDVAIVRPSSSAFERIFGALKCARHLEKHFRKRLICWPTKTEELLVDHPNARTCCTKVRLDLSTLETVYMVETDLALLPDDPAYDHEAFSGFMEAIRAYLGDHANYDRAEVIPIRGWENLDHTL